MKLKARMRRVDVQVSILVSVTAIICSLFVYFLGYTLTYNDMIKSLNERVHSIYNYVDSTIDKTTFTNINSKSDIENPTYLSSKLLLENIKCSTNVMYLYTAKKNDAGEFIYVVDGLSSQADDFRYPGDLIEKEICADMERALSGEIVLPNEIKNTDWGKIFITYVPMHSNGEIVGVLGIEFEAGHQYETYKGLEDVLPVIVFVIIIITTLISIIVFRRVSNPNSKDMYNTDQLTQLKNRNSYIMDLGNYERVKALNGFCIIAIDLNNLKKINDTLGHGAGDLYIQMAADAMHTALPKKSVPYRVGGDEYVIISRDTNDLQAKEIIEKLHSAFNHFCKNITQEIALSFSCGYAIYDSAIDDCLRATAERADALMYQEKAAYHEAINLQESKI